MSLDSLEIKFLMIAMVTLRHLAKPPANAIAMAAAPGGMTVISKLLDSEIYDDVGTARRTIVHLQDRPDLRDV